MSGERTTQPWARWALAGLLLVAVVLVALSPTFGRARPSGLYRPPLPPDALSNGCYPLPDGVKLDLPYQVRSDGDVNGRRRLVLQYDLIDRDAAVAALKRSFAAKGFSEDGAVALVQTGAKNPDVRTFAMSKPGATEIFGMVVPLDPLKKDQIVRGTITLDLPSIGAQSPAAVCHDVTSTKRFPSDEASHDAGLPGGPQ